MERLDKFLSNLGYGSRSEIKKLCKKGLVEVNKVIIKDSDYKLDPLKDVVLFDGEEVFYCPKIVIMVNKPEGYLSSNVDEAYPSLLNLLPMKYRRLNLMFAGRLDYDTHGLVLLSNDGNFIHEVISPKKEVSKTYYVKTKKKLLNEKVLEMPLSLLDGKNEVYFTQGAKVQKLSDFELYLTITEGKFHQVKRMLEKINNEVIFLKRVQIGNLTLGALEEGSFKVLDESDIKKIFEVGE